MIQQQNIITELKRQISVANYPAGFKLPAECTLAREFSVSRGTVRRALGKLAAEGFIESRRNRGYFVADFRNARRTERQSVVFLHPESLQLNAEMLAGMRECATAMEIDFWLQAISSERDAVRAMLTQLRQRKCGKLIFIPFICNNYYIINTQLLDLFELFGFHYVIIDTPIAHGGIIRGDFVGQDGYSVMRTLVRQLIEQGNRRFASIRVFPEVYSANQRFRGVIDELSANALVIKPEYHRVIDDGPIFQQGRKQLREIMALDEPPEVILCGYDMIAMNVLDELRDMNCKVPDDVKVAGFGDTSYYAELFRLTSVRQPMYAIGRRAVEILFEPSLGCRQEFLKCDIVFRRSTQPAADARPAARKAGDALQPAVSIAP